MREMVHLKFWEPGTALSISLFQNKNEVGEEYAATFHELIDDMTFFASSATLYAALQALPDPPKLKVAFFRGSTMFAFTGKCRGLVPRNGAQLVRIEQTSPIEQSSRRKDPREEWNMRVLLYGLHEDQLQESHFTSPTTRPEFVSSTLNLSAGGMCLVSNEQLKSRYEPYFLVEFSLGGKDHFLLPAKLVRKGSCPQTVLYKFDYGLAFLFDAMPDEKQRLQMAIFRAKLSSLTR